MRSLGLSFGDNRAVGNTSPCTSVHGVCLLVAPLTSGLDVSSAGAAAAQSHLHEPRENGEGAGYPHECEHSGADRSADVQFGHATDSIAEDDEHDGCENGGDGDEEGVEECEDGYGESEPAGKNGEGHDKDEYEGKDGASQEQTKHPVRHEPNQVEDVIDVGRQVDYRVLAAILYAG